MLVFPPSKDQYYQQAGETWTHAHSQKKIPGGLTLVALNLEGTARHPTLERRRSQRHNINWTLDTKNATVKGFIWFISAITQSSARYSCPRRGTKCWYGLEIGYPDGFYGTEM